jgi:hypothetical protein
MKNKPPPITVPELSLNRCSAEDYCRSLISIRRLPFWWYQGTSRVFGNYSLPFKDKAGNWWFQVKPGLCWPVELFRPISPQEACPVLKKSYFGYQHLVQDESAANSFMAVNAILDLKEYGAQYISSERRCKVRKGLRHCILEELNKPNKEILDECRAVWNDLSARTGWKHEAGERAFDEEWRMLLDCAGVTIILAREKDAGQIAGFYIVKVVGDTAAGDTIAVRSDMLKTSANDALRYAFLTNASKLNGVVKAHAAIRSTVSKLERYKMTIGYKPYAFPARTYLHFGVTTLLRTCFPAQYKRMMGQFDDDQIVKVRCKDPSVSQSGL